MTTAIVLCPCFKFYSFDEAKNQVIATLGLELLEKEENSARNILRYNRSLTNDEITKLNKTVGLNYELIFIESENGKKRVRV